MRRNRILYHTTASMLVKGFTFVEFGRDLKVTKCYTLCNGDVVVHDNSGMVKTLHPDTPVTVVSDN